METERLSISPMESTPQSVPHTPSRVSELPTKYTEVIALKAGQNADVYRAKNSLLNRDVFLKIYNLDPHDPHSALAEPQLLQALSHEHLTAIYDADSLEGGQILLDMELITGGSLQ